MDKPVPEVTFQNGLTPDKERILDLIEIDLVRIITEINNTDRHRSCSLAVTKVEEAIHWLRDRRQKPV